MRRWCALLLAAAFAAPASATTITIVNLDGPGEGFNDPTPVSPEGGNPGTTRGQQRLNLFQAAANAWAAKITSNVAIKVGANFDPLTPCDSSGGVLGAAGPTAVFKLSSPPAGYQANTWYPVAEAEAVQNTNLNTTENEIDAQFNSSVDTGCLGGGSRFWYGTTSPSPDGNKLNLMTVVLHELGHGLGFLSLVCDDPSGCGSGSPQGALLGGSQDIWNFFLKDGSSGLLWKDMSNAQRAQSMKNDQHLVWNGANVTAGIPTFQPGGAGVDAGTQRIKMYAPNPVELGSTVSHFDATASSPNLLMEPAIQDDFNNLDLTVALLQDIGWVTASGGVNHAPTLNSITNPAAILEDAAQQTVSLSGIGDGDGGAQTLTVTASSNNTSLIPNPTVTYTSPNSSGSLAYTPVANASGTATITVTVTDNGGTANGGVNTLSRTFTVTVTAVNDAPTLNAINNPAALNEDAGGQMLTLSGITAGPSESQTLTVTATSNNTTLMPNPAVNYVNPQTTATLLFQSASNQSGTATVTVTITDNGGTAIGGVASFSRQFTVTVNPVNDAPTLTALTDPAPINEDAGGQTVNLAGITAGPGESQTITVTATSGNPTLLPNPGVSYVSPSTTGALLYQPMPGQSGSATVTVTVKDNGGTASGGIDTLTRTFNVVVTPVNDAPTLSMIPDPAPILEDAGGQSVSLAGISDGDGAGQTLTLTPSSNNPALIPAPTVNYLSPATSGSVLYTPAANRFGTATITVTATDSGGTANGGVNSLTRTFDVTVSAVNDAPTLDAIATPPQTVNLAGITAGPFESQGLTVSASSDSPLLIANPILVSYTSPNATGSLTYAPVPAASGIATITVTVTDDGGTANGGVDTRTRTFVQAVGTTIVVFADSFE
jgi:hypothetical protein